MREVVYLPAYYPPDYAYYVPAYSLALPFGIVRQHRHAAIVDLDDDAPQVTRPPHGGTRGRWAGRSGIAKTGQRQRPFSGEEHP